MLRYSRFFLLITLAATLFHACDKSEFYSGKGVSFNASSKSIATKVSYGKTSNGIRAIEWKDKDQILIYCPQTTEKQCDYVVDVSKVTRDEIVSIAKGVSPVGESLKWSEGEHNFFCVYPSPSVSNAVTNSFDDKNNSWKGTIPAVQTYPAGGEYSDLSQYMMLVGYAECAEPQPAVNVDFYPVTTCLEFEMTNNGECDLIIKSISLSSSSQPLSGNFKVTYDNSKTDVEDRFVTGVPGIPTSNEYAVKVNFGEEGQAFNIDSDLSFKMFLNPAEDITNPTLTINAERKDGVSVVLSTTLKKKNDDLTILKKHITPLTGILVEGGILFTTFGEPELVQWEDDVEDNITVSDEYEYQLEVVGDHALNFDDSGTGLTKTLQVKSYKQAKDGTKTPVKPSLEFSGSPFVGTNTITLSNSAECIYDIKFKAEQNSPVVTTVDVSSALKNATRESNKDLSSGGTANCYVVKAPGTYKFEIAYGNKTKYDNTYDGTTKQPAGSTVDVLWSTSNSLITNLAVSDGYITFTVAKENIQQGNALIALKNGSTITWSWHIWFTDAVVSTVPLGYYSTGTRTVTTYSKRECTVVVSNPYDPFKSSKATITMSQGEDKEETSENISSGCTYYQWGRKDPFLVNKYTKSITSDGYTFDQAVQNPTVWAKATGRDYDWTHDGNSHYGNLWGSTKTVFDPCPPGYHVPDSYASFSQLKQCGYINDGGTNVADQAKYWTYSSDKTPGMSSVPAATAKDNGNSSVLKCFALCVMSVK